MPSYTLKLNKRGEWKEYPSKYTGEEVIEILKRDDDGNESDEWTIRPAEGEHFPSSEPNLKCSCGSETFKVCWWDYPYTGGYCVIQCQLCGFKTELIDDYA